MLKPKKKIPFQILLKPDEIKKTNKENNYKSSAFSSYLTKKPESQNPRKTH